MSIIFQCLLMAIFLSSISCGAKRRDAPPTQKKTQNSAKSAKKPTNKIAANQPKKFDPSQQSEHLTLACTDGETLSSRNCVCSAVGSLPREVNKAGICTYTMKSCGLNETALDEGSNPLCTCSAEANLAIDITTKQCASNSCANQSANHSSVNFVENGNCVSKSKFDVQNDRGLSNILAMHVATTVIDKVITPANIMNGLNWVGELLSPDSPQYLHNQCNETGGDFSYGRCLCRDTGLSYDPTIDRCLASNSETNFASEGLCLESGGDYSYGRCICWNTGTAYDPAKAMCEN